MVFIGAAAVAAVGAFLVVLLSPASQSPAQSSGRNAAGDATLTTLTTSPNGASRPAAQTAAKSMVELQADDVARHRDAHRRRRGRGRDGRDDGRPA